MNVLLYLRFCFVFICLLTLAGCEDIDPEDQEQAAVVTGQDNTQCNACGGWFVEIDTVRYRAEIPTEFACAATKVWIQFALDESDGSKKTGRWIKIQSIRRRKL